MDKNAIKKYAVWARRELIARVSQKALQYGITVDGKADPNVDSVNGRLFSNVEKKQRQALIQKVNEQGYEQVMEEVAYTWFNRFIALRFMEVNGYLPSHVRVFTNDEGAFKPQILTEAIHLDLDGLSMDRVYELKNANKEEELFKYLLIVQCNALFVILPKMFQRIEDYTELLLPDYLLREGSVIQQMIELIPEADWMDQVQIIGWLYQYYNTEPKNKVFADLKKNIKITKENIPAATQLFTPDWIVRYMVENSLGRLWLEGHPNDILKSEWKYYLNEAEQEAEVQVQLAEIRKEYATLKPEDIRYIDPCMGSGHILCYVFDVLVKIYEDYGYTAREAVTSIIENNLWGLDIDDRAAQLAYFAVMMKARQYDRRFFNKKDEDGKLCIPQPNVYAIKESNWIGGAFPFDMGDFLLSKEHQETLNYLIDAFHDAKEYGSILQLEQRDYAGFIEAWELTASQTAESVGLLLWYDAIKDAISKLVKIAIALTQKYHVVTTNPPYMAMSNASKKIQNYIKKNFPDSKADLFAVFIERCSQLVEKRGYQAMITQHAWMFLSSFEKLRVKLQSMDTVNMAHLGARAFEKIGGEVVQTTSFVIRKSHTECYKGTYCRLIEPTTQQGKEDMFLAGKNRYTAQQDNFSQIPGSPVAYWVSEATINAYRRGKPIKKFMECKSGIMTGDDKYIVLWFEVYVSKIKFDCRYASDMGDYKWFPLNSGGDYRKYYGNNLKVVNLWHDGYDIQHNVKNFRLRNKAYYFRKGITWGRITSSNIAFREVIDGSLFGDAGPIGFVENNRHYILGFLCSKVALHLLNANNPTLNYQVHDIEELPLIIAQDILSAIEKTVATSIKISKFDWDSFEISWNFIRHPLVPTATEKQEQMDLQLVKKFRRIAWHFEKWQKECDARFNQLKANEEELNRIFIEIYGLQDELTPVVEDKDVTVRKADLGRDIRSLVSYAVGCMFGRYSLNVPGLVYAGGTWDASKYTTFQSDKDAIILICNDEYFDDDIVGCFVKFIEVVYGKETLEENLKFIADALGSKGSPREVIRNYFLKGFYADHCKIYQKRPIYWLFDSGKKNGFKCLVYMHRYQPDTIARIRTDYVHEQQSRYRTAIADLEQRVNGASTSERVKLNKQLSTLQAQATEIRKYEEKIHHLANQMIRIDLDDGVKHNYELFKDVLAKIK